MANPRQKRKQRSGRSKVRMPNKPKKPLNPLGNDLIARNWNRSETLSQNYRRMGLVAKLGQATGGIDKKHAARLLAEHPFSATHAGPPPGAVREARLERDAQGNVVRVVPVPGRENPLGDMLCELEDEDDDGADVRLRNGMPDDEDDDDDDGRPRVIRALEREASRPVEKVVRHQSAREVAWLQRLVARHGDDVEAMVRDAKMNPMQQTAADIRRRLRKAGLVEP